MFSGDDIDNDIAKLLGINNPFDIKDSSEIEKEKKDAKTSDYGSDASSEEDVQTLPKSIKYKYKGRKYNIAEYVSSEALMKILEKIDCNFSQFQKCIDYKNDEIDSLKRRLKTVEEQSKKFKEDMLFCFAERDKQMKQICSQWNTNFTVFKRKRNQIEAGEAEKGKTTITTRSGRSIKKPRK